MFIINSYVFGSSASFPTLASLVARYRADLGVTKDGSNNVATWADQSGNGHDLTEGTNKPTWVANQINGLPILRFNGTNQKLSNTNASFDLAQPIHYFFVWNPGSFGTASKYLLSSNSTATHFVDGDGATSQKLQMYGGGVGPKITVPAGTPILLEMLFNNASSFAKINGAGTQTGTTSTNGLTDGIFIGSAWDSSSFMPMDIAEIVICSAEITGSELTALKAYFTAAYGLSIS
jgi:hypothetical protein